MYHEVSSLTLEQISFPIQFNLGGRNTFSLFSFTYSTDLSPCDAIVVRPGWIFLAFLETQCPLPWPPQPATGQVHYHTLVQYSPTRILPTYTLVLSHQIYALKSQTVSILLTLQLTFFPQTLPLYSDMNYHSNIRQRAQTIKLFFHD